MSTITITLDKQPTLTDEDGGTYNGNILVDGVLAGRLWALLLPYTEDAWNPSQQRSDTFSD